MPITKQYDEYGLWKPKSHFFQWVMRKVRAQLMPQLDPESERSRLAFCTTCGAAYLRSDSRPWSPCHATDPQLEYDLETLVQLVNALAEKVLNYSADQLLATYPAQEPAADEAPDGPADAPDQDGADAPPPALVENAPADPAAGADPAAAPNGVSRRRPRPRTTRSDNPEPARA